MARAQEQLAALVDWLNKSSQRVPTPLGRDWIEPGPYAVIVPQALAAPPNVGAFAPRHLPLWIPEQQSIPTLPVATLPEPESQPSASDRLRHLIWLALDGRLQGAMVPLSDPSEPLQTALDRHTPGLDLDEHLALFLPLWMLDAETRTWADAQLPLVRV